MFNVLQYGYAVIDLEKLDPLNVDDLCLSQYLAYILQVCIKLDTLHPLLVVEAFEKTIRLFFFPPSLQFVSQRHRPLRGRSARLLLDYIRTIPCKVSLTLVFQCCVVNFGNDQMSRTTIMWPYIPGCWCMIEKGETYVITRSVNIVASKSFSSA